MKPRLYYQIIMEQFGFNEQEYAEYLCEISTSRENAEWHFDFAQFPDNDIKARALKNRFGQ